MNTNSPCYKLGRHVNSDPVPLDNLRLETGKDCFYVLSYHHVELTQFESIPDADIITLLFLNRTVRIKGKNLRALAIALQWRNVKSINPMPERYSSLAAGEDGWVKTIEILEQKESSHA